MIQESDFSFDFFGRSALVAGGASGIGRAIAVALLGSGASVTILDKDERAIDASLPSLALVAPGRVAGESCDLCRPEEMEKALAAAVSRFGVPDFLVNSIASTRRKPALEHTDEDIEAVMGTNYSAVFKLCQSVARIMADAEPSSNRGAPTPGLRKILNIASTGAFSGSRNFSAYNASKAALVTLTKVLANEWRSLGIGVNALCPGPTFTPFTKDHYNSHPELVASIVARTPAGRIAEPEDMVGPVKSEP
ncbi:MAG: 2-deoxy-D-gluconate 3-dehydrogenase [Spirochaetes bacterium]|nr:MAG: 2-deoxy-D-gluconate 3-dehydrogenase [Spirochaetota bacterium]